MFTNDKTKEFHFQLTSVMRAVNILPILFIKVVTSKRFLIEVENKNVTESSSDYLGPSWTQGESAAEKALK